jgi:hypothetical protein
MIHKAHNRIRIGTLVAVLAATTTVCASAQVTSTPIAQGSISGIIYGPKWRSAFGGIQLTL